MESALSAREMKTAAKEILLTVPLSSKSGIPASLSWSLPKPVRVEGTKHSPNNSWGGGALLDLKWDKLRDTTSVARNSSQDIEVLSPPRSSVASRIMWEVTLP